VVADVAVVVLVHGAIGVAVKNVPLVRILATGIGLGCPRASCARRPASNAGDGRQSRHRLGVSSFRRLG